MLLYKLNERKMGCKAVVRISTTVENYEDKFGIGFLVIKRALGSIVRGNLVQRL
jgi:hypothetical protein